MLAAYRIEDIIGIGGMGIVYRAEQVALGRRVALKVLSPTLSHDRTFRERFRREGAQAASLTHPNVVTIFDSGEVDGTLFLAMMLVEGSTLADRLAGAPLAIEETLRLLEPIAGALDAAHTRGIVHRDVKPQNVLIDRAGTPFLADFGIAKTPLAGVALTATKDFLGSVNYMAPEQIRGETVAPSADVYALAAIVFQCLTGTVPFPRENETATMHAHLHDPPPTVPEGTPAREQLNAVFARGLAKDPSFRPASARGLVGALAQLRAAGAVTGERHHPAALDDVARLPSTHDDERDAGLQAAAPTQADRRRPSESEAAATVVPRPRRLSPGRVGAALVLVVALAGAGVALVARTSGTQRARPASDRSREPKRAGTTASGGAKPPAVSPSTTSPSTGTVASSSTATVAGRSGAGKGAKTSPKATASSLGPLEAAGPPAGSYSILVPSNWTYYAENSPEGTTTDVWTGSDPAEKLQVFTSTCATCAESGGAANPHAIPLPQGTVSSFEINPLAIGFQAYTSGDSDPDNGVVVVTMQGTTTTGYAQAEVWLPASLHATATKMLDSFSLLQATS